MFTCGASPRGLHGMVIGHSGEITSFSDMSCNRAFVTLLGFPVENSDACITTDSVTYFFPVLFLQVSGVSC
jgi:hypothetical protein